MKKRVFKDHVAIELEEGDIPEEAYTHKVPVGKSVPTGKDGAVELRVEKTAVEILGHHGRLLAASKTWYSNQHPDHDAFFNACIFRAEPRSDGSRQQIWFGDSDLTLEAEQLQELADRIGSIYVTVEPFRWEGLKGEVDEDQRGLRRIDPRRGD